MRTLISLRPRLTHLFLAGVLAGPWAAAPTTSAQSARPATPATPAIQPAAGRTADNPIEAVLSLPVGEATTTLDWGRVSLEQTVHGAVRVRNDGSEPITILAMRASCQCTALDDLSGTTLAPGESAVARVSVETRTIAGTIRNQLRFVFSDRTTASVGLVFEASRAVEAEPTYIDALSQPYGVIKVRSVDGRPFRILSAHGQTPIYAFAYDPARDEPRSEYMLVWNLESWDPVDCLNDAGEPMPLWWVVETDHPGAPLVPLPQPCGAGPGRGRRVGGVRRVHEVAAQRGGQRRDRPRFGRRRAVRRRTGPGGP
ncbi:MAG: DUF1573 domain-containing protein [Planctomycetota bacterium]|jgi:hypothetical protein